MLQVATDKSLTCAVSQLNRPSLFISGFKKTRKNRISKAKSDFTCYSHLFFIQPFWQLIPQETTMIFLCFDRPETNNCYCVIQWSASFSKTGYIWGQGFIYVLPLHISSAVFWFFFSVANMKQFPLTTEQPSHWVFSFLLQACQHKWIAMIAIVFSSSSMSIKNISQLVFSSTEAFSSILA